MKRLKYFGWAYADKQVLIDRVLRDLAGLGILDAQIETSGIDYSRVRMGEECRHSWIERRWSGVCVEVSGLVDAYIANQMRFFAAHRANCIGPGSFNLARLNMEFEHLDETQAFEAIAQFIRDNNGAADLQRRLL